MSQAFAMTLMLLREGRTEVDYDGFARNLRFYVGHKGTYTLAVCGAVGEYFVLTPEERQWLFTIAAAGEVYAQLMDGDSRIQSHAGGDGYSFRVRPTALRPGESALAGRRIAEVLESASWTARRLKTGEA